MAHLYKELQKNESVASLRGFLGLSNNSLYRKEKYKEMDKDLAIMKSDTVEALCALV